MNKKALIIPNSLELRQKLYSMGIIGFDSVRPKEDTDNRDWIVVPYPEEIDIIDPFIMYYSVDNDVKSCYAYDSYLEFSNKDEEEFINKLKEYYKL
jgi:hypothetical protein